MVTDSNSRRPDHRGMRGSPHGHTFGVACGLARHTKARRLEQLLAVRQLPPSEGRLLLELDEERVRAPVVEPEFELLA